jgi:4-hydroxybenzoate polyprenyltransferase
LPDICRPELQKPLFVDLDGTLIRTDLLVESGFSLIKKNILYLFLLPIWLLKGRAYLKQQISDRVTIAPETLPYRQELIELLREKRAAGCPLILITASPLNFANAVANHLGFFDDVLASDGNLNLKGSRKLDAIKRGMDGNRFDYAGDSKSDLKVWSEASRAIVVNPAPRLLRAVKALCDEVLVLNDRDRDRFRNYATALRLHHWLKNILVFVPLILAHRLDELALFVQAAVGFISFGLTASSVYLLNDLLDLRSDRSHPSKRYRPLASGAIPIGHAVILIPALLLGAIFCATALPGLFLITLIGYFALTLAYSLRFKHAIILDVIVLAALYTLRLIGGAAATTVIPSFWLLSFSMFLFLSLALVKRFSELKLHTDRYAGVAVRGYTNDDLPMLSQLGSASALMSVLVLALYINSDTVSVLYEHPQLIWMMCPLLLYLVSRIWLLAHRGKLDEDPVIFIIRDRRSHWLAVMGILLLWIAS